MAGTRIPSYAAIDFTEQMMDKAQIQALYRNRMSLPPEQREEIERLYKEMLASGSAQWSGTPASELDAADAAAVEITEDPQLTQANSGLYANLPSQEERKNSGLYANLPVEAAAPPEDPEIETARAGLYANLPSADERTRAGLYANLPPMEDGGAATAAAQGADTPEMERARSGLYANLPPMQEQAQPSARRPAPVNVDARRAELMRRGMDAEMANAVAMAEAENPSDPMSAEPTSPAVRSAIAAENARRAGRPATVSDRQRMFDSEVAESERQMANIRRLIRAGVNPAQDMTAPDAESDRQWREWSTSGSLDRMARYAPDEFKRREDAAKERRWKENRQAYQNRWDMEEDEKTGKTKGELYRIAQNQQDKERLARTAPQANRALARQLEQMGIDSKQFGDWRSDSFAREGALDAKNRAMASGELGGRYGAVQRRAQLRQNPMEYMGRPDVSDSQRRTLALLMSGGRGATANDVEALNAKMLLEGIGQGVDRGMRIGNMDMKEELAAMQLQEQRMQRAAQEADAFYAKRRGWGGSLDAAAYDDLIAMLSGMGLSDAQAQGLARRYKRSGGRAERTAPPAR